MRRTFILLLLVGLTCSAVAQPTAEPSKPHGAWIGLQGGLGYGLHRDLGLSPLTYRGADLHPALTVGWQQSPWRYRAWLGADGGAYGLILRPTALRAYGGQATLGVGCSHLLHTHNQWQLWGGLEAEERFDLRYNAQFGNADLAISNFATLTTFVRAEWHLPHWLLFGQLGVEPLSLQLRPGFAYIDNYDRDIAHPANNLFDQYHWYLSCATGLHTQLGAHLLLTNGNQVGLSYRWHFFASRTTDAAPYAYHQAAHALLFHLQFALDSERREP